jgi:hypothetical protein
MTVCHEQASLRPVCRIPQPEDYIVQARFKDLEQTQASHASSLQSDFIIPSELPLKDSVDSPCFLLGAQLSIVVRFPAPPELGAFSMLTWRVGPPLDRTLRSEATIPF